MKVSFITVGESRGCSGSACLLAKGLRSAYEGQVTGAALRGRLGTPLSAKRGSNHELSKGIQRLSDPMH